MTAPVLPAETTSLRGVIQDDAGALLAGLRVILEANGKTLFRSVTDAKGKFQFSQIPTGRYGLVATRGFGGPGEVLRRDIHLSSLTDRSNGDFLLIVWRKDDSNPVARNLWEELKRAIQAAPRDGLRDLDPEPLAAEPVIEQASGPAIASSPSGDLRIAQSFVLAKDGMGYSGLDAGFRFASPMLFDIAKLEVDADHLSGGTLSSPFLAGEGMGDERLQIGVAIAASEIDELRISGVFGQEYLNRDRVDDDETLLSSIRADWRRTLPNGSLSVRTDYARGVFSPGTQILDDSEEPIVQSFFDARASYELSTADGHFVTVGGAYRADRSSEDLTAWPGSYDDVAGIVGPPSQSGDAIAFARDEWRTGNRHLLFRYGVAAFYPLDGAGGAYVYPRLESEFQPWSNGSVVIGASILKDLNALPEDAPLADQDYSNRATFMARIRQILPEGSTIQAFAGTRDLRSLYLEAIAGNEDGDLPPPLFYTTGYALARELGLEVQSAPVGDEATLTVRYLLGHTTGSITILPLPYLRRDLSLGREAIDPSDVKYSQAMVLVSFPRSGTTVDATYTRVGSTTTDRVDEPTNYALVGGRVRQHLPFLDFRTARFAVLLAANQTLKQLYRIENLPSDSPERLVQLSGGIALTF